MSPTNSETYSSFPQSYKPDTNANRASAIYLTLFLPRHVCENRRVPTPHHVRLFFHTALRCRPSAARSCLPCELGYFNPTAGQSACQKCAAGQNCPIGSAGPVPDIPRQPLLQFQPAQARGGRMRGEGDGNNQPPRNS